MEPAICGALVFQVLYDLCLHAARVLSVDPSATQRLVEQWGTRGLTRQVILKDDDHGLASGLDRVMESIQAVCDRT